MPDFNVLSWSGLILNSVVDFGLPLCAALATMDKRTPGQRVRARLLLFLVSVGVVVGLVMKVVSGDPPGRR